MTGTTLVPMATVDPRRALRLIERERMTLLAGPPTMYLALMDAESFPHTNLASVRAAVCGSTSVPAELFARIRRAFGLQGITSGYGMTESSGVATFFPLDVTDAELASSVGPPLRDVRLRIVDVHSGLPLPDRPERTAAWRSLPRRQGPADLADQVGLARRHAMRRTEEVEGAAELMTEGVPRPAQ